MYVKLTNGSVDQFPYTIGQLRRDNPSVSFPAKIPDSILNQYDVYPVTELDKPSYDSVTQTLTLGTPSLNGNQWEVSYIAENRSQADAELLVRQNRDALLIETDWMALSDVTMSSEMTTYRQALRDVPSQSGFPFNITWPTKP
jgi:hypothetical protein